MDRKDGSSRGASGIPEGALPCVWMTAGLVAYKLCSMEYDCEHCPFDAALQGDGSERPHPPRERQSGPSILEFRDDRRYSATHTWVLETGGDRLCIGLDAFAAGLLGHLVSVILPTLKSSLQQDGAACWVIADGEVIPIASPVTGSVTGRNRQVQLEPGVVADSPYDEGWLLQVRCRQSLDSLPGLLSADEVRQRSTRQLERLSREVHQKLAGDAAVGPTLADGGERITKLRNLLGPARYHRLILSMLR